MSSGTTDKSRKHLKNFRCLWLKMTTKWQKFDLFERKNHSRGKILKKTRPPRVALVYPSLTLMSRQNDVLVGKIRKIESVTASRLKRTSILPRSGQGLARSGENFFNVSTKERAIPLARRELLRILKWKTVKLGRFKKFDWLTCTIQTEEIWTIAQT